MTAAVKDRSHAPAPDPGNLELERVATLAWTTSTRFGRDAADLSRFRDWLVGLALCIHRGRSRGAMKRTEKERIGDILIAAERICDHTYRVTKDDFLSQQNALIQDAVLRQLCIVSEAASNLPAPFRKKHPTARWTKIIETGATAISPREVNLDAVWDVATRDVQALARKLSAAVSGNVREPASHPVRPRGRR
jgi:uncharacterized protein with HEPN domain